MIPDPQWEGSGLHLIDTPVSGGFPGAQGGTLTMMAAAPDEVLDEFAPVMEAVSANIHRVGSKPGDGQTVKALRIAGSNRLRLSVDVDQVQFEVAEAVSIRRENQILVLQMIHPGPGYQMHRFLQLVDL